MLHGTGKAETTGHTSDKGCVPVPRYHLNEHRDSTEKVKRGFLSKKKKQLWNLENLCHF